jgi:phytoene dehydrogenase-like protein
LPSATFFAYTDYIYPANGIGEFSKKMEEKIKELGGEIKLNTKVESLDIKNHIAYDANKNKYYYDKLIWASDLKSLYRISYNVPENREFTKEKERILKAKPSESVVKIYIAVDYPPEYFQNISHGHLFYMPSRDGIGEINKSELENIKVDMNRKQIQQWLSRFCKYNSYEISIPALRNPQLAPDRKTGIIVNFFFDYELTKKIYEHGWYEGFKEQLTNEVIEVLSQTIYPRLREKVLFKFSSTPLTIQKYINSSDGAIVGWTFDQKLPFKNSLMNSVLTNLPDIYKTGQWVYSPAGVPMAILTGKIAAQKI